MDSQPDLFAPPAAELPSGPVHDQPREPIWWWRGFLRSRHGWTLKVYHEVTEGACIRACRALVGGRANGAFRVERMDFPAGW